jgi:Rad3-related DNA helicase
VCQEGVDFKGDRARFQIIVRIPYPATSSKFMTSQVEGNFPWYNFQSLIVFGQQIGRINRSEDDFGATFLVDDRFNRYVSRNSSYLPGWVKEAFVWR